MSGNQLPAADSLAGFHVYLVDVGALPVYFYVDEVLVHEATCSSSKLSRSITWHTVAGAVPMLPGWACPPLWRAQSLRLPGVPVDQVVGVLQEIGAGFVLESVHQWVVVCSSWFVAWYGCLTNNEQPSTNNSTKDNLREGYCSKINKHRNKFVP